MTLQDQKDLEKAEKSKSKNLTTNNSEVECAYIEGYLNCLKELRQEQDQLSAMTPEQRSYVEFIQEWSGVPYNAEDDFSKYISENKDRAQHNWDLECLSRALNFGF